MRILAALLVIAATITGACTQAPAPPGEPRGWDLTDNNTGLAPHRLNCDALPVYLGPAKPARGDRILEVRIEVPLDLSAGDIVIEKSCIRPTYTGDRLAYLVTNTTCLPDECTTLDESGGIVIRDSEINGLAMPAPAIAGSCAFDGVATLERNVIHGMGSGICFRATGTKHSAVATRNYVHGLRHAGDAHHSAATVRDLRPAADRSVRFVGNRLDATIGTHVTAALFIQPTYAGYPIVGLRVEGNLFEGETYNLVLEQSAGGYSDVHAVGNRFAPAEQGAFGPASRTGGAGWTTWQDNRLHNTTERHGAEGVLIAAP
jgi:hypothetical protein